MASASAYSLNLVRLVEILLRQIGFLECQLIFFNSYSQCATPGQNVTNRERLISLITAADITRAAAAQYISEETKRPCSWRTVQAWLADPDKVKKESARTCPDWAIETLTARLKALKLID